MKLPKIRRKSRPTEEPKTGSVHIYRDTAGEFRFRVTANNGKLPGEEGYVSPSNAFAGMLALRRALVNPEITEEDFRASH